ncbi:MAG: hypothetical protein DME99_12170 [Verrucomicrobia bacterium]|nr:MAG: hypothetical protein DME99_12170 [Verrucomicrobiota bacterium]
MRTFRAGEAEGPWPGTGEGVTDSSGKIEEAGDSSGMAEGVGVGDSCAKTAEVKNAISIAVLVFVVMSSRVETSLI